jgi:hypothetical protein
MQRSALSASADRRSEAADLVEGEDATDVVVVHVQLRPRRGATRKCLAALATLAAEHPSVSFAVTGLSKDDRVVRVTVGVELGPRLGVARFSPQAQAAYAFVSALFTSLYDHMPVYAAEPSEAERAAAATLMDTVARPAHGSPLDVERTALAAVLADSPVPTPRPSDWGERVPA